MDRLIHVLIIVSISIILRVKRIEGPNGVDGIYLLWEGHLLFAGQLDKTLIHPLSYIGAFPFSPYPIGSVFFAGLFQQMSNGNLTLAIFLFNTFFIIIGSVTAYSLFSYLFENEWYGVIGSLIYINIPFLMLFSYTNISARTPFVSILPLIILTMIKSVNYKNVNEFVTNVLLMIIMSFFSLFFHRMSFVLLAFISITLAFTLMNYISMKTISKDLRSYLSNRLLSYFSSILLILSYFARTVFGDTSRNYEQPVDLQSEFLNFFIRMFTTHYQKSGIILVIGLVFICLGLFKKIEISGQNKIVFGVLIHAPVFLLLGNVIYVSYFLSLPFAIMSLYLMKFLEEKSRASIFVLLVGLLQLGFMLGINFLFFEVGSFLILFFILSGLLIAVGFGLDYLKKTSETLSQLDRRTLLRIFTVYLILFNSIFYLDFALNYSIYDHETSAGEVWTSEQTDLANYIAQYPNATIWTYSRLLTARIALQTGWYQVDDLHSITLAKIGYYSQEEILNSVELKSIEQWGDVRIFDTDLTPARNLHSIMLGRNITNFQQKLVLENLNVPFFVGFANSSIGEFWPGKHRTSVFVTSLIERATVIHTTDNYHVYDLRPFLNLNYTQVIL